MPYDHHPNIADQNIPMERTERYISPHKLPTPYERELLTILGEEAAEIVIAVSKLQRFGSADGYPGTGRTNANDLGEEIGDLLHMVSLIEAARIISYDAIERGQARKRAKLPIYLQTEAP